MSLCALVGVSLEPCPSYPRDWSLRPSSCAEIKKFKKCQKRAIFGPKSFTAFSAEASRRGWEPRVGEFAAHNMHMLLPKTHPVWFRFSEAANGQIEKRAIFTFFQKVKKIDFYKSQKLIDLSNAERSWGPI